jgi:hypothetical protein
MKVCPFNLDSSNEAATLVITVPLLVLIVLFQDVCVPGCGHLYILEEHEVFIMSCLNIYVCLHVAVFEVTCL